MAGGGGGAWRSVEPASLFHLVLLPPILSTVWTICDRLRVSFTTFSYKIWAVREELLQEHVYLPLVLVQDSGFIASSVTGFIAPSSFGNWATTACSQFVAERESLSWLLSVWVPWEQDLLVSIHQNRSSCSLLSKQKCHPWSQSQLCLDMRGKRALSWWLHCVVEETVSCSGCYFLSAPYRADVCFLKWSYGYFMHRILCCVVLLYCVTVNAAWYQITNGTADKW